MDTHHRQSLLLGRSAFMEPCRARSVACPVAHWLVKVYACGCMFQDWFAGDNEIQKTDLHHTWLAWARMPWQQPYNEIRDYFGEKIAMYFAFLGKCVAFLLKSACFGQSANTPVTLSPCISQGPCVGGLPCPPYSVSWCTSVGRRSAMCAERCVDAQPWPLPCSAVTAAPAGGSSTVLPTRPYHYSKPTTTRG